MSVEQSQSERIVNLEETIVILGASNAALSSTVAQMWNEVNDLRGQMSSKETAVPDAPSISIASGAKASNGCGIIGSLHGHIEAISSIIALQKQMVTLEHAVGEMSFALILEKMAQMQRTMDDLKASNAELKVFIEEQSATIEKLADSNAKLNASNIKREASNTDLASRISVLEMWMADSQRSCADVQGCLNVSVERRETLSEDLYNAALQGNVQRIHKLMAEGANFDYRSNIGDTALHQAAKGGHVEAVRALIVLGCPLDAGDSYGQTSLHKAVMYKREECVKLLLLAGTSVNARDKWSWTPLHFTVCDGTLSIVQMLIDAGADREAKTIEGKRPRDIVKSAAIRALL